MIPALSSELIAFSSSNLLCRLLMLGMIISYLTNASGIILLKKPTKYGEFFPTFFVKTTDFQVVFNFEQTRTVTIFGEHGIMAHIP